MEKRNLEGEIYEGGLKLHNIELFDNILKVSWLRRFFPSNSKWTIIPQKSELDKAFKFGAYYLGRILEMTENKFWKDVIKSLLSLWHSEISLDKNIILNTPLWYNNKIQQ